MRLTEPGRSFLFQPNGRSALRASHSLEVWKALKNGWFPRPFEALPIRSSPIVSVAAEGFLQAP